jgi:hypothetical protein
VLFPWCAVQAIVRCTTISMGSPADRCKGRGRREVAPPSPSLTGRYDLEYGEDCAGVRPGATDERFFPGISAPAFGAVVAAWVVFVFGAPGGCHLRALERSAAGAGRGGPRRPGTESHARASSPWGPAFTGCCPGTVVGSGRPLAPVDPRRPCPGGHPGPRRLLPPESGLPGLRHGPRTLPGRCDSSGHGGRGGDATPAGGAALSSGHGVSSRSVITVSPFENAPLRHEPPPHAMRSSFMHRVR